MSRMEITIAGVGGQGSILAGVILGTAAVNYDGKYAVQTQAYSSQQRGGYAACWVIVSDEPVIYPRVTRPDVLVAQAQDSIDRFGHTLKEEGLLITDKDLVGEVPSSVSRVLEVPATTLARRKFGTPLVANMILLGVLCGATDVVSASALEKAIEDSSRGRGAKRNLEAFYLGLEHGGNPS
jgi:2-oxoglutarate ferredoxin oxidoreductase subunit gamma